MSLPSQVSRSDVVAALTSLGIPPTDLLVVTVERKLLRIVQRRRDAEGRVVAAGDEVATLTTTVGITDG